MCLAAVEISRRGYEFLHQFIRKDRPKRKNIIFADIQLFSTSIRKSMEETGLEEKQGEDAKTLFNRILKANKGGTMYRRRIEDCKIRFVKFKTCKSRVQTGNPLREDDSDVERPKEIK